MSQLRVPVPELGISSSKAYRKFKHSQINVELFRFPYYRIPRRSRGARVGRPQAGWGPPVVLLLAVPWRLFCFWFFGDLRYGVPLFIVILVLYINMKIGKSGCWMLNVWTSR